MRTVDARSVTQRVIGVGGDPFAYAATALAEMLPSERDRVLREHYAVEYREEIRSLARLGLLDQEEGEEEA
jgi:hypothetical protein